MTPLMAQGPKVGVIDFYGVQKTSIPQIRRISGLREGAPLSGSKGDIEDRLMEMNGVTRAELTATCCERGNAIVYVGLEEKGAPHFDLRPAPTGDATLPETIGRAYAEFLRAASTAARAGESNEDLTRGYSLMQNDAARAAQQEFILLADQNLPALKAVLHDSANEEQRAIAAYVIGYSQNKAAIADELLFALQDPDETVRENALRNLGALAVYARKEPQAKLAIRPAWVVEMLNSLSWRDRHNAAVTLVTMTESREPELLTLLKDRAATSLYEMALWKHLPHALPAYILAGRMGGIAEAELESSWSAGQREQVIARLRKSK